MNKKIIVIVVIVECILAILLISFLGKAIETIMKNVYSEDVYFTDADGEKIADEVVIEFTLSDTNRDYQLFWVVESKRTTNKDVIFSSNKEGVVVDETGKVTFLDDVSDVIITVKTLDGSEKSDSITIVCLRDMGNIDVDI